MIQFCTCNKRFTSSLEIPEGQESSKSCRSCGRILSVCGLSRKMWSAVGPEFSRLIDPQLKWKTSSNGKHRALRRARTFTQDNGKKFPAKNEKDIDDFLDKASKKEGDMLVSESEKLGVRILGQRFSDNLESVPIKKRRFSLPSSQSTPHLLSSSGFHDHNLASCLALFQNNQVSLKQKEAGINWGEEKSCSDENRSLECIDKHIGDSADFSGISILAAAACCSSIEKGIMDAEGPTVSGHSLEENHSSLMCSESHNGKDHPSNPEHENNKAKQTMASFITVEALGGEPDQIKSVECNVKNSVGSTQSSPSRRKSESSLDDRLHWDLNTVMDIWESQTDDFSNFDRLDLSNVKSNGSHDIECGNQRPCQDKTGFGIDKVGLITSDNQDNSHCLEEEMDRKHTSTVEDCDEGKHGLVQAEVSESLQEECQFNDGKFMVASAHEKTNPAGSDEKSCLVTMNAYPIEGVARLARDISTKTADASEEEKRESNYASFSVEVDVGKTLSYPVSAGNAYFGQTSNACNPIFEEKKINEMLHDDSRSSTNVDCCNDHSGECYPTYVVVKNNQLSPHAEKHESLSTTDVALSVTVQKSPAGQLDQNSSVIIIDGEKTFKVSVDGSNSKGMTTEGQSDETAYTDEFGNAHTNVNQSAVLINFQGTSDNEQLPSRSACTNQFEEISTDFKVDDSKSCILSGECLNARKTASPFLTSPKLTNSISEGMMLDGVGIPLVDDALISHGESRTPADGHVRGSGKESFEEHLVSENHSDASPIATDLATGLEKVDFLGDDDSQYEDGELRESILNSWGEDGAEEVETEHVDYGSDCREADFFEAESEFCSQSDLTVGTTECKNEGKLVSSCSDGIILRAANAKDDSQFKCFQKHVLIKDASNVSYGVRDVGVETLKSSSKKLDVNVAGELPASDENRLLSLNIPTELGDVLRKSSQPEGSRMKSSGWDKLPRSEDAAVNSLWNHDGAFFSTSVNGEYARRMVVSSVKMDLSSRVERSKSSEASCRKEVSYARENMTHDHVDLNTGRSSDATRSIGRSRLPFRSQCRDRVDCWVSSPDNNNGSRFDTSGYYPSTNFTSPSSRNAAEAAVAKVKSNGFVVAHDGTIVKAGIMGSGSHLSGRSSKSSAHLQSTRRGSTMEDDGAFCMSSDLSNSREVIPDRCFNDGRGRATRYNSGLLSPGHRNRYHASMVDGRIDSLSSQNLSSRRQRSFSPHRRPIRSSREHTRSPSRSRTKSPYTWTSPRGRDDGRLSGALDARRQSRSPPTFNPQRRILRQRSPQRRAIPAEELAAYAPSSRNHSSPPHASRWFDTERILQDRLREHQPRCATRRSPPARIYSQSNRHDHIHSRGRVNPDECYQPLYSGKFQEYTGYGRGSKHDSRDVGRREKNNRYEMLHHDDRLESNGNMKCLRYDDNGSRAHTLQPNSSGFQRRKSPRTFDRSIDAQREDSPRRIKGEMVHFRHARDGKSNTDFNSFGVRDTSDDMSLQRRPS